MAKRRRRQPLKRALTEAQVRSQIERFDRLLDNAVKRATEQLNRVGKYRKRLHYYQGRLDTMQQARLAESQSVQAVHAGRQMRPVQVDGG